ncbi:NAD(P)-dependent oxidoreductase [Mucilaginibacter sp. MD40]|uniref:glucose 1-dehydrogenase n=1 Tax=Mucilaginibacter sp. MD40 TaxID=2029590 RepID=UPI000BAC9B7A|nr:glucose 1-dehydrogenase [Mucilaginibacter sp. MD40]PAW92393.1 NAD(P)-dependent oxidoreductase [Mucilaginibacter sp. MD40]
MNDPRTKYENNPFPADKQPSPGSEEKLNPTADHGESSYKGCGKLEGRKAIITGGDSGIGRAVAIAFAREGADVLIAYLNEHEDAKETARYVEEVGRKAILVSGDICEEAHCRQIIDMALSEMGGVDIIVNNAAFQMSRPSLQEISTEEWDRTFKTNIYPMFYLCKMAEEHLKPGSAIINTTSVNAYKPKPTLIPYAATKGAIQNFTSSMAQLWGEKGIRVNCVAPGPIWTPLIPSTMTEEEISKFGQDVPLKRAGQPAELAAAYVMLASEEASFISGATIQVTGGIPTI